VDPDYRLAGTLEGRMNISEIVAQLRVMHEVPRVAIRAAEADRASAVPAFLAEIDRYLRSGGTIEERWGLYWMFHLLGQWREKSAYRPLAQLLRSPPEEIDDIFSVVVGDTVHRVMGAVFDGDPKPLYDVILDEGADEYVRGRLCEALAVVAVRGDVSRDEIAGFLRSCYVDLRPQSESFVWNGWSLPLRCSA
jgi:uncharacterized protein